MSQGVSPLAYLFSAAISSPTSLTLSTPPRGIPVHRKNFVASLVFFPASTGLVSLRYFWALPPLGVTGPDVRDLMGYRITIMLQGLPNLHPGGMVATGLELSASKQRKFSPICWQEFSSLRRICKQVVLEGAPCPLRSCSAANSGNTIRSGGRPAEKAGGQNQTGWWRDSVTLITDLSCVWRYNILSKLPGRRGAAVRRNF